MIHATHIDGHPAKDLAIRFVASGPGLAKLFLTALTDKVQADAKADAGRGCSMLSAAGERAAAALQTAAEMIPGRGGKDMERFAETVGDLRYDALRDAIAWFVGEVSGILLADAKSAARCWKPRWPLTAHGN